MLDNNIVLALGGGTPCYAGNMNIIKEGINTIAIYLKASIVTIATRLTTEKNQRPLVARLKNDELVEFIAKHLFERSYFYNQSNYKVTVDDKKTDAIVTELNTLLG